jgi:hypothetical protein
MHVFQLQMILIIKSKLTKKELAYSQARRVFIRNGVPVMHVNSQFVSLKYTQSNLYLNNNEKIHVNIYI